MPWYRLSAPFTLLMFMPPTCGSTLRVGERSQASKQERGCAAQEGRPHYTYVVGSIVEDGLAGAGAIAGELQDKAVALLAGEAVVDVGAAHLVLFVRLARVACTGDAPG